MEMNGGEHENHPDDSHLSDIDKEWLGILDQIDNNQGSHNTEIEELTDLITGEVYNSYRKYNLPRVVDSDPIKNIQLGVEFIDNYRLRMSEETQWSAEGHDNEISILIKAFKAYHDRREAEMAAILCAVSYRLKDLTTDDDEYDELYMLDVKSNLLAHLQVHYKLEPEWLQFFHDATNDYEYSPYYEMIEDYHVNSAWESLPEFMKKQEDKWRIFDQSLVVAGVNELFDSPEYALSVIATAIDMMEIALEPISDELDRANRNELMWECGRETDLDVDTIKKLADYFDSAYPLED